MTTQPSTQAPPARHRARWWKRIGIALLVVAVVTSMVVLLIFYLAGRAWNEAVAEADRLDPGWRFEELEAKRADIPDDENSALRVLAAHKLQEAPSDPYDGQPLRYRHLADGWVIYSVGPDRADDGGKLARGAKSPHYELIRNRGPIMHYITDRAMVRFHLKRRDHGRGPIHRAYSFVRFRHHT